MSNQGSQARPAKEVLAEVMDSCRAKSEHEWVAAHEIERLTRQLKETIDIEVTLHDALEAANRDRNNQHDMITMQAQRIAELEEELDNERFQGIHSCHPQCKQPLCVANKRIAELEERDALLSALEAAGVDNWEWYGDAYVEFKRGRTSSKANKQEIRHDHNTRKD